MNRLGRGVNLGGVFDRRDAEPVTWHHRDDELAAIAGVGFDHVRLPVRWADHHSMPLYVGEFGAFHAAREEDRVAWTTWVRQELDRLDLRWAYWDFATDFGIYDRGLSCWRSHLLHSLIDPSPG